MRKDLLPHPMAGSVEISTNFPPSRRSVASLSSESEHAKANISRSTSTEFKMRRETQLSGEWMADARTKLTDFIKRRSSSVVWKTFEVCNADFYLKRQIIGAQGVERRLMDALRSTCSVPCVVCQEHLGVIFCRLAYKNALNHQVKRDMFKPCVYLVLYPRQTVLFSSRDRLDHVIVDALIQLFGAPFTTAKVAAAQLAARQREESLKQLNLLKNSTNGRAAARMSTRIFNRKAAALEAAVARPAPVAELSLRKLPLTGRGFRSLHQLHHRKLCWQLVQDSHPPRLRLTDSAPCPICQLDPQGN